MRTPARPIARRSMRTLGIVAAPTPPGRVLLLLQFNWPSRAAKPASVAACLRAGASLRAWRSLLLAPSATSPSIISYPRRRRTRLPLIPRLFSRQQSLLPRLHQQHQPSRAAHQQAVDARVAGPPCPSHGPQRWLASHPSVSRPSAALHRMRRRPIVLLVPHLQLGPPASPPERAVQSPTRARPPAGRR